MQVCRCFPLDSHLKRIDLCLKGLCWEEVGLCRKALELGPGGAEVTDVRRVAEGEQVGTGERRSGVLEG